MPSSEEWVPALQVVQVMAAYALLYLPCSQAAHELWPVEVCAFPGVQAIHSMAPVAVAALPALHVTHADDFRVFVYEPLLHAAQMLARGPDAWPGSQSVQLTESASEAVPELQALHVVALLTTFVLDPAGHARQAPSIAVGAYRPMVQPSHEDWLNM